VAALLTSEANRRERRLAALAEGLDAYELIGSAELLQGPQRRESGG
jgi:hypothetical protein